MSKNRFGVERMELTDRFTEHVPEVAKFITLHEVQLVGVHVDNNEPLPELAYQFNDGLGSYSIIGIRASNESQLSKRYN